LFQRCAKWCGEQENSPGPGACIAITVIIRQRHGFTESTCYYTSRAGFTKGPECYGTTCPGQYSQQFTITNIFGVFTSRLWHDSERYKGLPSFPGDGQLILYDEDYEVVPPKEHCQSIQTTFGKAYYRRAKGIRKSGWEDYQYIEEYTNPFNPDCAKRCFDKAGCTSFHLEGITCGFVIGPTFGNRRDSKILYSGQLDGPCTSNYSGFKNEFQSSKRVAMVIAADYEYASDYDHVIDDIVANNMGSNTRINTWQFSTFRLPIIRLSQYVHVNLERAGSEPNLSMYLIFTVKSHLRIGTLISNELDNIFEKRRRDVEEAQGAKEDIEEGSQDKELRATMPSLDEILAEMKAVEQKTFDFILGDEIQLPADIEVTATGPIETVEFIQKNC